MNGLILLPFVLTFSPAGYLSDKHQKPLIMKVSSAVAVGLTLLITLSYYLGWFHFSFAEVLTTVLPDSKKGVKVILLMAGDIDQDEMQGLITQSGLNPFWKCQK